MLLANVLDCVYYHVTYIKTNAVFRKICYSHVGMTYYIIKGSLQVVISKKMVFLSLKIDFDSANSGFPDEIPHDSPLFAKVPI